MKIVISKKADYDNKTGDFINKEFTDYALKSGVDLNFEEFCFVAEDDEKNILGVITGRAYYNEIHIGDLIVGEKYRNKSIGSALVGAVEKEFSEKGYDIITLTTFGFQAPEFYPKLGYKIEFIRDNKNPKLSKYFLSKKL